MRRSYSGNARTTTLAGGVSAAAVSLTVADGTGYPTGAAGPFVVTLDAGNAAEEKVLVTSRTGNTLSVQSRGWDGTTASDHDNASSVQHTISATDLDEANALVSGGGTIQPSAAGTVVLTVKGAASQTAPLLDAKDNANNVLTRVTAAGAVQIRPDKGVDVTAILSVSPSVAGDKGLVVRCLSGQTANPIEVQNSAGGLLMSVLPTGQISAAYISNDVANFGPGNTVQLGITAGGTGHRPLVVRGAAGQTANLAEFQNNAGTVLAYVNQSGVMRGASLVAGTGTVFNAHVSVANTASDVNGLVVRGAAGQTANLAEFQNSAGTLLALVSAAGEVWCTTTAGVRKLEVGAPDSGGAGFRTVRVAN